MSRNLTISETGLKLIKAYEGYRPVDRELVTGQRIVGYGHRLYSENAVRMSKAEAEETLRIDLEPFEEMINTEVHAPLTQSQFDALCSFAYNIGPKAFLTSDTLRALNNGRPLDAANGIDIWRKSEIAGKTYVVDALMRRRTAEKALFLRTERDLPAGRADLPPVIDTTISTLSTEDALPVFSSDDANGVVATTPHDAAEPQFRRREDGPAGPLAATEIDTDADIEAVETDLESNIMDLRLEDEITEGETLETLVNEEDGPDVSVEDETDQRPSPIAAAATDIVARLDALIEDAGEDDAMDKADWPESLITSDTLEADDIVEETVEIDLTETNVIDMSETFISEDVVEPKKVDLVIDALAEDDAFRVKLESEHVRTDSAARYIQHSTATPTAQIVDAPVKSGAAGLWIPVILGFLLLGCSGALLKRGAEAIFGQWGPILVFSGIVIGVCLILMGVYAALRMKLKK